MYLIFDTETTGLPKSWNAPITDTDNWPRCIQIAWQLHDALGNLVEHNDFLIQPDGFNIPYDAERIHGISTELAQEQGVPNAKFQVTNALDMTFEDNTFDIVWACESGEHMPDKELYINEMMRVLKPGGKFVMATWCQRDDSEVPFTKKDKRDLQYLYEEW